MATRCSGSRRGRRARRSTAPGIRCGGRSWWTAWSRRPRARSPRDGRVVHVGLTAAGRELVRGVSERRRREVEKVLSRLPDDEVAGVVGALRAFNEAAGELEERDWAAALW